MPKETPTVIFPLSLEGANSGYEQADIKEAVRFNLKNIILTNPGERIMIPDFGVGISAALFENYSDDLSEFFEGRIADQIDEYAPYVTILDLTIDNPTQNNLSIRMRYVIDFVQIVDFIEIDISNI